RWSLELYKKTNKSGVSYGAPHCVWKGSRGGKAVQTSLTWNHSLTDGAWHQVTCARTSTGEQLVVDGTLRASNTVDLGSVDSTAAVYVGRNPAGNDYYQGLLDDFTFTVG